MSRRNLSLEPFAQFRVGVFSRPEIKVEIPILEPIFIVDNAVLGQWGLNFYEVPMQALLVRNPDAWRLKILQGPPAEKDGIASLDWLLDSQLILQWGGLSLNLDVPETDQNTRQTDTRSGLFQMAATLAAGNLQLEQDQLQLQNEAQHHQRQRKSLAQAWRKRVKALKKKTRRLRANHRYLVRERKEIEEAKERTRTKDRQIRTREESLDKSIDRMVSLRARAVTRWRSHINGVVSVLEQRQARIVELERHNLEIQAQLNPLMERLGQEQNRINQADHRLSEERTEMRGAMDAWRREELARQGQWLQRQAELTQKENQIRTEAGLLLKLRATVQDYLAKQQSGFPPAGLAVDWESILKSALNRESEFAERQAAIDSWTKRLESWAGALGEREMLCAKREQDLAAIATEYHGLRLRREEELSRQGMELYQKEMALLENRTSPGEPRVESLLETPQLRTKLRISPPNSTPVRKIDLTLGPRALDLAQREKAMVQREADLVRLKTETEARARKLAEEAIVLERYRSRLMGESKDTRAGKKEIRLLVDQWKKRTAVQSQSLVSLRDYLFRLGKKLKKWSKNLAMREANIVETELRLLEERTRESIQTHILTLEQGQTANGHTTRPQIFKAA